MSKSQANDVSRPGKQLGKYQILKKLAVGGMAEIYLARARGIEGFEKHVVLKRILPEHAKDERFVEMFLDEARLAARLQHHNIAQVYDIGQTNGAFFFSMEYLHGEDLRALLKAVAQSGKKIPLKHVLTIIAGSCAGLHYAHNKKGSKGDPLNIVHRDVSPSNIIVTYEGGVKVVDFGIAKAAERSTETKTNSLKGKISYMSPEQCKGLDLDPRSDIFCLGIVLYELSTVTRLFRANPDESDYVVMDRIVNGKVQPPSRRMMGYPPGLEKIVMKALQVDREDRYDSAKDMLSDIEEFAAMQRIPLSTASLSKYLEDIFGEREEPWHDLTFETLAVPEQVDQTVSTTGSVEPYREKSNLEGTMVTLTDNDIPMEFQEPVAPPPMVSGQLRQATGDASYPTVAPGQVIINNPTLPPGMIQGAMLNQSTGQLVPVAMPSNMVFDGIKPTEKKSPILFIAMGALLVLGAVGFLIFSGSKDKPAPVVEPAAVVQQDAAPVEVAPEIEIVSVSIQSSPNRAEVYLNGKFVGKTPHIHRMEKGSTPVKVRLEASGRQTQEVTLDGNQDTVTVELQKRKSSKVDCGKRRNRNHKQCKKKVSKGSTSSAQKVIKKKPPKRKCNPDFEHCD